MCWWIGLGIVVVVAAVISFKLVSSARDIRSSLAGKEVDLQGHEITENDHISLTFPSLLALTICGSAGVGLMYACLQFFEKPEGRDWRLAPGIIAIVCYPLAHKGLRWLLRS
jgi:hypothetical protein